MGENQDISKIIGIIMENPDIIEKIKSLAQNDSPSTDNLKNDESTVVSANLNSNESSPPTAEAVALQKTQNKKRRRELLSALKPYVKSDRAKAIDTMLSVIDVIDVMKER